MKFCQYYNFNEEFDACLEHVTKLDTLDDCTPTNLFFLADVLQDDIKYTKEFEKIKELLIQLHDVYCKHGNSYESAQFIELILRYPSTKSFITQGEYKSSRAILGQVNMKATSIIFKNIIKKILKADYQV